MVAAAAGVPAVAAMALEAALAPVLAAAPPVRAARASASRVPAALLDQHLERGLVPSCWGLGRRAPRAHGNDLRTPGDDSQPGPPPTTLRQICIDVLCAYLRMPYEPDPGDLSTPRGQGSPPAVLADPAPSYEDRSRCIGVRCPRGRLRAGLFRWPWLVGVFADECGQDFQNCGVVPGRIVGDALWRVDAAEANVELAGAELLDRVGVAVSHLPVFGEFDNAAQLRCSSCGEGSVRGQNSNVIYPG